MAAVKLVKEYIRTVQPTRRNISQFRNFASFWLYSANVLEVHGLRIVNIGIHFPSLTVFKKRVVGLQRTCIVLSGIKYLFK